ncbi:hypothetical protein [Cytobacillus firmus]|uniref:hypothetical protein n=1 Tax=Cytobacillus firmus TaxID=1399 RepID=UPI0018CD1747|nr:hypothetical protein [Cytobacillus firmus]
MPNENNPQKNEILFTFDLFGYKINVTASAVGSAIFSAVMPFIQHSKKLKLEESKPKRL